MYDCVDEWLEVIEDVDCMQVGDVECRYIRDARSADVSMMIA